MGRRGSIPLARFMGIRIGVDASWFVVLFVYIWFLSSGYKDVLPGHPNRAFALAVASALLFFLSVLLHELGHAVVARRNGVEVTGINLWMFGGFASLRGEIPSAGAEFRIAAAGPLVTFVIVVACYGAGLAIWGPTEFGNGIVLKRGSGAAGGAILLAWLASINALVLFVNLIPALPLDGGRMLRAIAWWRTGDRNRASRASARVGRAVGGAAIGGGLLLLVSSGALIWLWVVLLGFFMTQAAGAEQVQSAISERLGGLRVVDVVDAEPVAIQARTKLDRAQEEFFLRYGWPWFPVVDDPGHVLGVLTQGKLDQVPEGLRTEYTADQVMIADQGKFKISQDAPLETLLAAEGLTQLGALLAVDADGVLRGIVTADQVRRALRPAV